MGLSRLRAHKKRHNFADTPSDICLCKKGIEDTHHYNLVYPFYNAHRKILTSNIDEILHDNQNVETYSVNLLLYGHDSLPSSENKKIICNVLEYIENTQRLSS